MEKTTTDQKTCKQRQVKLPTRLQTKAPAPIETHYKLEGNGFFSAVTAAQLKESKSSPPTIVSNR